MNRRRFFKFSAAAAAVPLVGDLTPEAAQANQWRALGEPDEWPRTKHSTTNGVRSDISEVSEVFFTGYSTTDRRQW